MKIKISSLKKGMVVFLIVLFAVPVVSMAKGQGRFGHERGFDGPMGLMTPPGLWRSPQVIEELGLTDAQIEKIKEIEFDIKEQRLELGTQIRKEHLEMEKLMSADDLNESAIVKQAKKISDLKGKALVQMIENQLKVRSLLNDDQQKKLKSLKTQFFHKRHQMTDDKPFFGKR